MNTDVHAIDRRLTATAQSQLGLVTRTQSLAAGFRPYHVDHRLASGRWSLVHDAVYRIGAAPSTTAQLRLAAVLAIDGLAAVSHRAAAELYGIWWSRPPAIEITTTDKLSPELAGVTVHRIADLSARWITTVGAIPCTTVARTLVDLGAVMPDKDVAEALDRARGRGLVSFSEVKTAVEAVARRGRRGVGVMRRVLEPRLAGEPPAGVLEARMARLLAVQGLPSALPEYRIWTDAGHFVARVDFAYPELRLAIEVDGYEAHSSVVAFRRDRTRQNELVEEGWTVLRFTWGDVDGNSPSVGRAIRGTLNRLRPAALGSLHV
jgi:hypothetical protein